MAFARKDRNISLGVFLMFFLGFFLIGFIVYMVAENQKYFEKSIPSTCIYPTPRD
jgi:hypothetical protein